MDPSVPPPRRRLAAVWFADIVGFSTLSHVDEDSALRLVEILQGVTTRATDQFEGRVVKFLGDAALSVFESTEAAVRSAVELMESYHAEAQALGSDSTLRIGVHLGEVVVAGDDIYGDGVNTAARLQGTAEPGQVLVSEDVWRQLRMRPEFRFESMGEVELRGITARIGIFHVLFGARAARESAVAEAEAPSRPVATTPAPPAADAPDRGSTPARRRPLRLRARHTVGLVFLLAGGSAIALWTQHPVARTDPDAAEEPAASRIEPDTAAPARTEPVAEPGPATPPVPEPDAAGAVSPAARPVTPRAPAVATEPAAPAEPMETAADPTTHRELAVSQCIAALDAFALLVSGHTGADFAVPFEMGARERAQLAAVYLRADGPMEASILSPTVRRLSPAGAEVDFVLLLTFRESGTRGSFPLPFRAALRREPATWQLVSVSSRS